MEVQCNRYSGVEDFRFPALKCRLRCFKDFYYAPRSRELEVEGIFVYKSAYPKKNPSFYSGFLDLGEEYRLLGLKPPESDAGRIDCEVPADLVSRDSLLSKPNVRLRGKVLVDADRMESKRLSAESIEFLPIQYRAVGTPAFSDLDDMFSCIYSRSPEFHEYGPLLLLASLIGSERRSSYFPDENVGCGVNMGATPQDVPGKVSAGRITPSLKKSLGNFIRRVNVGSLNSVSEQFSWSRFLAVKDPAILSRTYHTENEIDWNLVSDISDINRLRGSKFMTSDINLVFDPSIFPQKISRDAALDLRQTILFAKSTPQLQYSEEASAWIENMTDRVIRGLAKEVDYAPFLFRYRFEPLCDAFLKGTHLADYLVDGSARIRKKDVAEFFSITEDAASDFADYAKEYVESSTFSAILDSASDRRMQDLYKELLVKGGMGEDDMAAYLLDRFALSQKKAESLIESLIHAEPALVFKRGSLYLPLG